MDQTCPTCIFGCTFKLFIFSDALTHFPHCDLNGLKLAKGGKLHSRGGAWRPIVRTLIEKMAKAQVMS